LRIGGKLLRFCGNVCWWELWIVELVCPLIISKQRATLTVLLTLRSLVVSSKLHIKWSFHCEMLRRRDEPVMV
jgi:hypothetical protein